MLLILALLGSDFDTWISQFDHDEFQVRSQATENILKLIDKDDELLGKLKEKLPGSSLERRTRINRIIGIYCDLDTKMAPIWSLPSKHRFVDEEDLTDQYWKIWNAPREPWNQEHYNNARAMQWCMQMFICNQLFSGKYSRAEAKEIIKVTIANWDEECKLASEAEKAKYFEFSLRYAYLKTKPRPVEQRLEYLRKILAEKKQIPFSNDQSFDFVPDLQAYQELD
jgi:hypothetical protein